MLLTTSDTRLLTLGALLRQYRGYHSVRQIAAAAGLDPATLSRYERGDMKHSPPIDSLASLAKALGVPLDNLLAPYLKDVRQHLQRARRS